MKPPTPTHLLIAAMLLLLALANAGLLWLAHDLASRPPISFPLLPRTEAKP
jgi:hypothetical protein